MKKLCVIIMSVFLVGIMTGCQSQEEKWSYEEVGKELLYYAQEFKKVDEDAKIMELYDQMDQELGDVFHQETLKDVKIKIITFLQTELDPYTLPIEVTKVTQQEGDSQIITIQFQDQQQKSGEVTLRMQEKDQKISYVGVYKK